MGAAATAGAAQSAVMARASGRAPVRDKAVVLGIRDMRDIRRRFSGPGDDDTAMALSFLTEGCRSSAFAPRPRSARRTARESENTDRTSEVHASPLLSRLSDEQRNGSRNFLR
ncbi:hypothetical protein GCM10010387_03750 [Streptomyces inusitatus]|uniref:Uncharacterized protein n=1 Tax=Streptomyces inusitatus TaxID=68221 RepID=A0A918PLA4_9ACTN|nr:hypothetical protein GCM10010387_03750 [Streptomyces inusitatus]